MAKQQLESKFICSIYPEAPPSIKKYVGDSPASNSPRCKVYSLSGVKKNSAPGYEVLEVTDTFENVEDILGSTRRRKSFQSRIVPCERMVKDLIQEWAGNMVGIPAGIGPGIMEITNSVPTTAELEVLHQIQSAFFEHMFSEGERLANNGLMKEITRPMVLAAEWFGRKVNWATSMYVRTVPCPHCKQNIPPDATVCHICHRTVSSASPNTTEAELADLRNKVSQLLALQAQNGKASEPVAVAPIAEAQPHGQRATTPPPSQPTHPKPLPTGPQRPSE